jgi:hypothetical protein
MEQDQPDGELRRGIGGDRPVGIEDLVGPLERPGDETAVDDGADLVQAERERGDDTKVGARPSDRPEEVLVLLAARGSDLAVRGDDLDLLEVSTVQP